MPARHTTPTFARNVPMPASLDLWLIRFSIRAGVTRAQIIRDALTIHLKKFAPEDEPDATIFEMIEERWKKRSRVNKVWIGTPVNESVQAKVLRRAASRGTKGQEDLPR